MKYANHPTWTTLSAGSRFVRDGAANVDTIQTAEDANANIRAVEGALSRGQTYPELIAASLDDHSHQVLIEGHTRATAYVRALPATTEVEVITARSAAIGGWVFY